MKIRMQRDAIQYMETRSVSLKTLTQMRCESAMESFGDSPEPSIRFPYFKEGKRVNHKARSINQKSFRLLTGGELTWYNLDRVLKGLHQEEFEEVFIVEGEIDVCSLVEAQIPNCLSVPNGVSGATEENTDRMFPYIDESLELGLRKVKRWIIATDRDAPGELLRKRLAKKLGEGRCLFVEWPEGYKDANEFLVKEGPQALFAYLQTKQKHCPYAGVVSFWDIPEREPLTLWEVYPEWERKCVLAAPSLTLFSGWPGHGKSTVTAQMWAQVAKKHKIRILMLCMETEPKPYIERELLCVFWNKSIGDMSKGEIEEGQKWIAEHFWFMNPPRSGPNWKFVLDAIEFAKSRYDISAVCVDPWNRINSSKPPSLLQTDYIRQCLNDGSQLARAINICFQIVCHPKSPNSGAGEGSNVPITMAQIAGSQAWSDVPEQILSVWRPFKDKEGKPVKTSFIAVHKTRYRELGTVRTFEMICDENEVIRSDDYSSY